MGDQVASLNGEPPIFQVGIQPDSGVASCTDCCVAQVVRHVTGRAVSPETVRLASGHTNDWTGLTPNEALRALSALGVKGYGYHPGVTADQAISATDSGIVIVGVGYWAYPRMTQAEIGGKSDFGFAGPHAITLWGRRQWLTQPPPNIYGHSQVPFTPGWRVWCRDPDHTQGWRYSYDRFLSTYLVHAMQAIIGTGVPPWATTFMISRSDALETMLVAPEGIDTPIEQPLTPTDFE